MGFEYQVKVAPGASSRADYDRLLRGIPGFAGVDPKIGLYTYRVEGQAGPMANAEVAVKSWGLYVCDYGGGEAFLSAVVIGPAWPSLTTSRSASSTGTEWRLSILAGRRECDAERGAQAARRRDAA
jgi:hypothetical protein